MSAPDPGTVCPQCGEARGPGGGDRCAACGSVLPVDSPEWKHPLVEAPGGQRPSFRFDAAGATLARVAFRPERTFARFRWSGGLRSPFLFSVLVGGPCVGLAYVLDALLATGRVAGAVSPWRFLGLVFLAPPLYLYVRAHVVHLILVLQGVARRPFEATFRAVAYSNSSVAPGWLVPPLALGSFLFLLWGTVVEITALREAHRLGLGRAVVSVVLPIPCALILAFLARATLELLVAGG